MSAAHNDDRWEAVLNGWLPVSAMNDHELGKKFPKLVRQLFKENALDPGVRRLQEELTRELYERTDEKLRAALLDSVDTITDIAEDVSNDPAVRLRAAQYLLERVRGKTPDIVEVRQDKPFQVVLDRIVAGPRPARAARLGLPDPDGPIEAEIVAETKYDGVTDEWPEWLAEEAAMMRAWTLG